MLDGAKTLHSSDRHFRFCFSDCKLWGIQSLILRREPSQGMLCNLLLLLLMLCRPSKNASLNLHSPYNVTQGPRQRAEVVGVLASSRRYRAYIRTPQELEALLADADADSTIRLVAVSVQNNRTDLHLFHEALDAYLAPRFYWIVKSEPQEWQQGGMAALHMIKVNTRVEPYYRFKSWYQYPSAEDCAKAPMHVFNGLDAWGAKTGEFAYDYALKQFSIVNTYFSRRGDPHESNAMFMDAQTCPTIVDKFRCAFLPMTNCSTPKGICTEEEKADALCGCADQNGSCIFVNATEDGVKVKKSESGYFNLETTWNGAVPRPEIKDKVVPVPAMLPGTSLTPWKEDPPKQAVNGICTPETSATCTFFVHAMFLRQNSFFRSRVQEMVHNFRVAQRPVFAPTMRCAAVHVRWGDRALDKIFGQDMIDYCNFCSKPENIKTGFFSIPEKGINETCDEHLPGRPDFEQLGCSRGAQAFGAITLRHYLDAVDRAAPDIKHVVIMTDSGDWLEEQRRNLTAEYTSRWHLHVIPALPKHRENMASNGINFLASLALLRQCDVFVGPVGCSAATQHIMGSLCVHHGLEDVFWQCPTHVDMCKERKTVP